jgi:hypothetical protein
VFRKGQFEAAYSDSWASWPLRTRFPRVSRSLARVQRPRGDPADPRRLAARPRRRGGRVTGLAADYCVRAPPSTRLRLGTPCPCSAASPGRPCGAGGGDLEGAGNGGGRGDALSASPSRRRKPASRRPAAGFCPISGR